MVWSLYIKLQSLASKVLYKTDRGGLKAAILLAILHFLLFHLKLM